MTVRPIISTAAIVIGTIVFAACVGEDPDPDPASAVDGGPTSDGTSPTTDGGGDANDGSVPATDSGADSAGGAFCKLHPAAALCEDFEVPDFPPGGWKTQVSGATLEPALGYSSSRALAAFHDATTVGIDGVLYRDDVMVTAAHTHLKLAARVRATTFADARFTTAFYLRITPTVFVTFAITSATSAVVTVDGGPTVSTSFSLGAWHHVEIDITLASAPLMDVRFDGAAVGGQTTLPAIAEGAKRIAAGVQTSANTQARRIEIDDILVELTQ